MFQIGIDLVQHCFWDSQSGHIEDGHAREDRFHQCKLITSGSRVLQPESLEEILLSIGEKSTTLGFE